MSGELLRMPRARFCPAGVEHLGIIVEKTGEDNDESKKNRVMYLYSPTVRKHCGKLVCSVDWRDYRLGDWIIFTQSENEAYFGSYSMPTEPHPTRISPSNFTIVQVYVHFFLMPKYISYRRTQHLMEPLLKAWSPELGGMYIDVTSLKRFGIEDDRLYKGWVQYSPHAVNFNVTDEDPEGWPYEPTVHWNLLHEGFNNTVEEIEDNKLFLKFLYEFQLLAKETHQSEKEKRIQDRQIQSFLFEEDRKLMNDEPNAYSTVAKHGHVNLKPEPKFVSNIGSFSQGFGFGFNSRSLAAPVTKKTIRVSDFVNETFAFEAKSKNEEKNNITPSFQSNQRFDDKQSFFKRNAESSKKEENDLGFTNSNSNFSLQCKENSFFGNKVDSPKKNKDNFGFNYSNNFNSNFSFQSMGNSFFGNKVEPHNGEINDFRPNRTNNPSNSFAFQGKGNSFFGYKVGSPKNDRNYLEFDRSNNSSSNVSFQNKGNNFFGEELN